METRNKSNFYRGFVATRHIEPNSFTPYISTAIRTWGMEFMLNVDAVLLCEIGQRYVHVRLLYKSNIFNSLINYLLQSH